MYDLLLPKRFQRRRRWLHRAELCAAALILAGCGLGFVNSLTELLSPKPDRHKILFSELARQTTLLTGTPTIVKENDEALVDYERAYNQRNEKLGLPMGNVTAPEDGVLQFSYAPGIIDQIGSGLIEIPGSRLVRDKTRPTIWSDEPGSHSIVVWVYSARQRLLACFVYQLLTPDHPLSINPPRPDVRIIQSLDWSGVVSVHGDVPNARVFPEHAFLLPLGDLKLDNLDRNATEMPNLFVFLHGLPMVMSPVYDETNKPSLPTMGETITLLRKQVAQPFFRTRSIARFGVLPLGVVWLAVSLWRMKRLRLEFNQLVGDLFPALTPKKQLSLFAFQTADLEIEMNAAAAEARSIEDLARSVERQRAELDDLNNELLQQIAESQPPADEVALIKRVLASGSLPELRSLASGYRLKKEREKQIARERDREIQWLASEFEAVPPLKRVNEAREAWNLYQQALTHDDPRVKLHCLKDARKKLPRDLLNGSN